MIAVSPIHILPSGPNVIPRSIPYPLRYVLSKILYILSCDYLCFPASTYGLLTKRSTTTTIYISIDLMMWHRNRSAVCMHTYAKELWDRLLSRCGDDEITFYELMQNRFPDGRHETWVKRGLKVLSN